MIHDEPFVLEMPDNNALSIMMVGSTRSGKSTALSCILEDYFKKHIGVLMTNSPQAEVYGKMDIVQSPEFIPKIIKDMAIINKNTNNKYDFLVCLDDIVTKAKFNQEITKMLCVYRNSNMSCIYNIQKLSLVNTAGRTNTNVILIFKQNSDLEFEVCIKTFLNSYFPPKTRMADKIRWLRENTQDHHFIVVDCLRDVCYRTKIKL